MTTETRLSRWCRNDRRQTWYTATTTQGEYVESGLSIAGLIRVLLEEILAPDSDDVLILDGSRVVALISMEYGVLRLDGGSVQWQTYYRATEAA